MSEQQFREASQVYGDLLPQIKTVQEQLKQLRKQETKAKRIFRKYMKQNQLNELNVHGATFMIESKEKVQCNLDLIEQHFNSHDVDQYVRENTVTKEVFKVIT